MTEWGHVDLTKTDDGWGGVIPCGDVQVGVMRYWLQGVDASGEPIANSGDPKHPYSVPIRESIAGEAPHLPDKPAPSKCGKRGGGGEGGAEAGGEAGGEHEEGGERSKPSETAGLTGPGFARLWVGIAGAVDFLSMPSVGNVCTLTNSGEPQNSSNLYCTNPDGSDFPSRNANGGGATQNVGLLPPNGQPGQIGGGLVAGDLRIMLSVDYALLEQLLVGGRIGYVANAYTGQQAGNDGRAAGFRVHLEGRATYLFGKAPLRSAGFVPMAFAGLGFAEFDGHSTTVVKESYIPGQQPVNVWLTDGPVFLVVGGGVRYQFSPRAAFTGAIRLNMAFPGNGVLFTYGPEIGFAYGF
jgi:hypothetical protein